MAVITRIVHLVAIGCIVGSAGYAYSTKYGTIYLAEEVKKAKQKLRAERDAITVLKAEWQHLNKPERLQILAQKTMNLQNLEVWQMARYHDIPLRAAPSDAIGAKIETLGVLGPTATPGADKGMRAASKTPGAKKP